MKESIAVVHAEKTSNDKWVVENSYAVEEDVWAVMAIVLEVIDYNNDWIVDSGCSNNMTGDKEKL